MELDVGRLMLKGTQPASDQTPVKGLMAFDIGLWTCCYVMAVGCSWTCISRRLCLATIHRAEDYKDTTQLSTTRAGTLVFAGASSVLSKGHKEELSARCGSGSVGYGEVECIFIFERLTHASVTCHIALVATNKTSLPFVSNHRDALVFHPV